MRSSWSWRGANRNWLPKSVANGTARPVVREIGPRTVLINRECADSDRAAGTKGILSRLEQLETGIQAGCRSGSLADSSPIARPLPLRAPVVFPRGAGAMAGAAYQVATRVRSCDLAHRLPCALDLRASPPSRRARRGPPPARTRASTWTDLDRFFFSPLLPPLFFRWPRRDAERRLSVVRQIGNPPTRRRARLARRTDLPPLPVSPLSPSWCSPLARIARAAYSRAPPHAPVGFRPSAACRRVKLLRSRGLIAPR